MRTHSRPSKGNGRMATNMTDPTFDGLSFEVDVRDPDPDASGHRRARFRIGWENAVRGKCYDRKALRKLTWDNLGWRLGKLLGRSSQETVEQMYQLCVKVQPGPAASCHPHGVFEPMRASSMALTPAPSIRTQRGCSSRAYEISSRSGRPSSRGQSSSTRRVGTRNMSTETPAIPSDGGPSLPPSPRARYATAEQHFQSGNNGASHRVRRTPGRGSRIPQESAYLPAAGIAQDRHRAVRLLIQRG